MDRREYAPTIPEHDLIARCKRGEREAQRALYEQTCERVLRLLQRMTHSPETAEDLAQDTYLKAFSAIATFDERSAVQTWLYRIAVNEALQWLRRKRPSTVDPDVAALRPDPRNNGHEAATRLDIESAMALLDPIDRAIVLLRYQEGLDYQAISEAADVAMGTVASRLHRARQRLRELLGDFAPTGEENRSVAHRIQHGLEGAPRGGPTVPERTF